MSTNSSTSSPHALDHLENAQRDAEGRLVIGNVEQGCPFCGAVATKVGRRDDATVHHPALECCAERLAREITWRLDELKQAQAQLDAEERAVRFLHEVAEEADTRARRQSAEKKAQRAEANLDRRRSDHYQPRISALAKEIHRLKRKRSDVTP